MGQILVKEREVVVPGETLAEGMEFVSGFGTIREDKKIIASQLGLFGANGKVIKLIPLAGKYFPKKEDIIIGKVSEILFSGWMIETNCAYHAMLSMKEATSDFIERGADLTKYYNLGDYIVTKIYNVTSQNLIDVTMKGPGLRKLTGGQIITINHNKVPRVIGKKGSMIAMIKDKTGVNINVGQNGVIWLKGEPEKEVIAVKTIRLIESKSHVKGLTEQIKLFLEGPQ